MEEVDKNTFLRLSGFEATIFAWNKLKEKKWNKKQYETMLRYWEKYNTNN